MQAKKIFQSICGTEEEFLPAIPNPEDIIMDDVNEQPGNNVGIGTIPSDDEAQDEAGDADDSDHTHDASESAADEGGSVESASNTDGNADINGANNAPHSDTNEGTSA